MKRTAYIFIPLFLVAIWFGNLFEILEVTDSYGSSFVVSSTPVRG